MLQGVGEDGENMRNLLFSVFSGFSLLLPFLSPTPEEINPHSFRFSMQTREEIPTVSVLLAGNRGGIQGLLHCLTSRGCVWVMTQQSLLPAQPGQGTTGTHLIFVQPRPIPSTLLLMICQLSSSPRKPCRHLHFFLTIALAGDSWVSRQSLAKGLSDLVPGTAEPVLCCPSAARAAKAGSLLSPTRAGCSMWHSASATGSRLCCSHHTLP